MNVSLKNLEKSAIYHIMTQTIIPRPIAWILSENENQTFNIAPFSYFNGVCSDPPLISVSIGKKKDGSQKDTWHNIEKRNKFVIHIVPTELTKKMVTTAKPLEYEQSELELIKEPLIKQADFTLPRIKNSPVAFNCKLDQIIELGNGPQALIIGEIESIFIKDDLLNKTSEKILVDPLKINPIARLGLSLYNTIGEIKEHK